MIVTPDQIRELATLHGDNVLVTTPDQGDPWVISTENRHYQGAHTVLVTSGQVAELLEPDDWDDEGGITDEAAQRVANAVMLTWGMAFLEALDMKNPAGHPDAPQGSDARLITGAEFRKRQAEKRTDGGENE